VTCIADPDAIVLANGRHTVAVRGDDRVDLSPDANDIPAGATQRLAQQVAQFAVIVNEQRFRLPTGVQEGSQRLYRRRRTGSLHSGRVNVIFTQFARSDDRVGGCSS
jgi:hypothetical protein